MNTQLKKTIAKNWKDEIEMLKLSFENSPVAMFLHVGNKLISVNGKAEKISGYGKDELLNMNFWELVHPESRDMVISYSRERLKGNRIPDEYTVKFITKEKKIRFADVMVKCINYYGGKAVLGYVVDVTESVKAEETWKTFFEYAPVGFVVIDKRGNLVNVNQESESIFGNSRLELIGLNLFDGDLVLEADKNRLLRSLQRDELDEVICPEEIGIRKSNGLIEQIELRTYPFDLYGENLVLGCVNNLSMKRCAEIEFRKAAQRLKELNLMRSRFITKVSHEFRTPLATILSSVELLELFEDSISGEEKQEHYKRIIGSIDNLTQLLNDLVTINDAETGLFQVNRETFDIVEFVVNLKDKIIEEHKSQKNIKFISNSGKFIVNTDKKLMRQIIYNLVDNSINYSNFDGNIYLNLKCTKKNFIIIIEDEGAGIPAKAFNNIYTPFFQADNAGNISGAGLGLTIVKKSVELLNGEIEFISKINKGTKFIVRIPS